MDTSLLSRRQDASLEKTPLTHDLTTQHGDDSRLGAHLSTSQSIWNGSKAAKIWSWVAWIASVLLCSTLLSTISASFSSLQSSAQISVATSSAALDINSASQSSMASLSSPAVAMDSVLTIAKRASSCGSGEGPATEDDMPLRIGAVFIILCVSASACAFPVLASRVPGLRMPADFFFSVRHFGTGVLIATAFCHLLPTAFTLLHDPCLDELWTQGYPAMPGAIALGAVIFVTAIEMWMHPGRHHHAPPAATTTDPHLQRQKGQFGGRAQSMGRTLSVIGPFERLNLDAITSGGAVNDPEAARQHRGELSPAFSSNTDFGMDGNAKYYNEHGSLPQGIREDDSDSTRGLTPEQKLKRETTQCLLLEMGILFHSVFIGMALSVSLGGSEFVILLIAISFHQTFEGLALGARIAAIDWPAERKMQPWFMALAYGCTTPLGQAIGLATRSAYSPDSEVGLILVGVMNSISSGLLIFASLVELLSEDLLSDESWKILRGKRRVCAFMLVIAGAFGMSLVGAWA